MLTTTLKSAQRVLMAASDTFQTFLLSAAVAGVSIGGTMVINKERDSSETLKQASETLKHIAVLDTKMELLSTQIAAMQTSYQVTSVLEVRLINVEKIIDKQADELNMLRASTLPKSIQEYRK